ncbi:MAG: FAD:protein FMN transferase [Oscillospiraceae bacterium]
MKRRFIVLCLTLSFALTLCGCNFSPAPEKQSISGFYFDTVVTISAETKDETLLPQALELCKAYEQLLSRTLEGSDVWKINHAKGQRVEISADTRKILEKAIEYSKLSEGGFDITIAPVVALWDFTQSDDDPKNPPALPSKSDIAAAAKLVDYRKIDLNEKGVLLPAEMSIDLGGIAKGYITDRVSDFLLEHGVKNAVLNFGGNVFALGSKSDKEPWRIGIQDPNSQTGESIAVLELSNQTMVTSGIYERGFTLDGVCYHHLLDTKTGFPLQNGLASVTIICEKSVDGDGLSTACFALGEEKAMALIEALDNTEAVFISRDREITASSGLKNKLEIIK